MTFSHGFRRLANVIEHLEANGLDVDDVATTDDQAADRLTVDLTVTVPLDGTEPLSDATEHAAPDADTSSEPADAESGSSDAATGAVRGRVLDPISVRADDTNGASAIDPGDDALTDADGDHAADDESDEAVCCPVGECDATFESDHGMKIHRTKVHGDELDTDDEGAPAYRDPDRLREVYAACDSFPKMRKALDTDVSTQTVRRQMIAHGIYEPGESNGADPGDDEEARPDDRPATAESAGAERDSELADGAKAEAEDEAAGPELASIELPEGVSVADLKSAVASAQTLYDVQQCFDLDRDQAMELLDTYDLLSLVHGRVSDRDRRKEVDEDEITRRILEHAPVQQPSGA
jgi:hypothetical protein